MTAMPKRNNPVRERKRYPLRLSPEVLERVRHVAQCEETSMQKILEQALTEYLRRYALLNPHKTVKWSL